MELDASTLDQCADTRILVVGDSMLDRYWLGGVDRISPEAPVPVLVVETEEERIGGAANVAKNITSMGGHSVLLTVVGGDDAGRRIGELVDESGIESAIHTDKTIRTTVKLRLIARNQQLVRADFEDSPDHECLADCLGTFRKQLDSCNAVVLSDYGKGGLKHVRTMIELAIAAARPVYIDPKGRDYSMYQGASLITPNLKEFTDVVGELEASEGQALFAEIAERAERLMSELNISACLVTLSEQGMLLCRPGQAPIHQAVRSREVYDVTGAGDTVISMISLALASGHDDAIAMALANHAAGVVVAKLGTATADRDDLLASFQRG